MKFLYLPAFQHFSSKKSLFMEIKVKNKKHTHSQFERNTCRKCANIAHSVCVSRKVVFFSPHLVSLCYTVRIASITILTTQNNIYRQQPPNVQREHTHIHCFNLFSDSVFLAVARVILFFFGRF